MTLVLRRCGLALLMLLTLWGCTTLPRVEREPIASQAIGVSPRTTLGRIATGYQPDRLTRARNWHARADVSLDVQYQYDISRASAAPSDTGSASTAT